MLSGTPSPLSTFALSIYVSRHRKELERPNHHYHCPGHSFSVPVRAVQSNRPRNRAQLETKAIAAGGFPISEPIPGLAGNIQGKQAK